MNVVEQGRESVERSPVFVDASGRRRRGVTVLGYLGASACTAYLAAFGITLSTHAGVIDASGVALEPSPSIEGGDEVDGLPADVVVPAGAAGSRTVSDAAVTTHTSQKSASRPAAATGGRHAAPHVGAPDRGVAAPLVPVRVVRGVAPAGSGAAPASSPRPTTPHGGTVPGTPQPTPDTSPTTGGSGGSPSSGGAGPTTGTGTTGGSGGTGTTPDTTPGTTPDTTTDTTPGSTTPTGSGSTTPAVLDIGPLTTPIGA